MHPVKAETSLSARMNEVFRFFNALSEEEVSVFLGFCESRMIDIGQTLWKEGDSDNYSAFVISGKVGIKKKTEFEGKYMIVGTFARGTVIGELCLLTDHVRSVTAVVLETAEIVILTSKNFEKLITERPLLGLKLLKHIFMAISNRLSRSTDRMARIF